MSGGGDFLAHPGPVLPPGAGPGWVADPEEVVTGPLPALKLLAGRFSERLADRERLSFCAATLGRGEPLGLDDQRWLVGREQRRNGRDAAILAALNGFCGAMAAAVEGYRPPEGETT